MQTVWVSRHTDNVVPLLRGSACPCSMSDVLRLAAPHYLSGVQVSASQWQHGYMQKHTCMRLRAI